jgi:ferric-dicitrate binding protein FerR (iron transport regulator)
MKPRVRQDSKLAMRWFLGERLTEEEEQHRLELAQADPLHRGEQALLSDLRQFLEQAKADPSDDALVKSVLQRVAQARPRALRLVGPTESAAPPVARAERRSRWWVAALLPAVAAAGLFLNGARQPQDKNAQTRLGLGRPVARAELVFLGGAVSSRQAKRVGGGPLAEGSVIETDAGQACLTIDPGIDVCLAAHSRAKLTTLQGERWAVNVEAGLCLATLSHRAAGATFSLTTDKLRAEAKGTTFGVDLRGTAAAVVVLDGSVEVTAGSRANLIAAHSRWTDQPSAPNTLAAIGRAEEAQLRELLAPLALGRTGDVGILTLLGNQMGLRATLDDGKSFALPLETFVATGQHRLIVKSPDGTETHYTTEIRAGEHTEMKVGVDQPAQTNKRAPLGSPHPAPSPGESPQRADSSPKLLLEQARAQLKAGNTAAALARYAELKRSFPSSSEARTVLPLMGKLELEQRRNPAQALVYFDAYLSAPGALAQEALSGRIRALRALGRLSEERRAIEEYRGRYPASLETRSLTERLRAIDAP